MCSVAMKKRVEKIKNISSVSKRAGIVLGGLAVLAIAIIGVTALVGPWSEHINKHNGVAEVRITKDGFVPATLSVAPGTKVVWTNEDQALRQVVANPFPKGTDLPGLKSEILNNTQTYSYVAEKTGSFGYHDQLHPTVNGILVVEKQ